MHPLSKTGSSCQDSPTEALTHISAIPVTSVQLSGSSFPMGSKPSPDSLAFNSTGRRQADLYDSASEMVVVSSYPPASQDKIRNQQIPERSPQVPSERQLNPPTNYTRDPCLGSVPSSAWPISPSLDYLQTDPTGVSQITIDPGNPVNLSVFDWNSIPNPLIETTISTSACHLPSLTYVKVHFLVLIDQPASVYVPSSDLAAMNWELPDPLYLGQSTEKGHNSPYPLDDLGSLEDFSLLQFPMPTTFPPDVSVSPSVSFCSDNSTSPSPEMDWSAITDFINQFSSFSAESLSAPSPSATVDAAPSTPENSICSLLPPSPHEISKPISVLDPSIPPSVFLPPEPNIFTEDASMWSLLCGLS